MSSSASITLSRTDELNAVGARFFREGQLEPARLHFLAALVLEPNHAQALQNLGAVLRSLNHYAASESVARRSVVASGDNAYCRSNLGVAQLGLRKYNDALMTLKSVVRDLPNAGPSWHNYGLALYMLNRHEDALRCLDKSLALTHDNLQVRSDRALALLALGKIQEGLAEYEVRWDLLAKSRIWDLNIREWRGEALNGCRILVHHEQGFGDGIMLARFLTPLAKLGCSITLAVPNELLQLFSRSFRFIHVIDMEDATLGDTSNFDYHVPMLSLMRWLKVKTPAEIDAATYLYGRPIEGLRLPQGYRIGVCWASGNHGAALIDRRRIVPITSFLPLTEIPGVSLVALQKSDESADIVRNGMEGLIFDVSHRLEDFAVAADIISQLDLVISVDSAIAHLAGAMGKPCFMLSPFTRCWRWWNKTSGWPWYNRMTLFHQVESGSWNLAMRRIVEDVKKGRVK